MGERTKGVGLVGYIGSLSFLEAIVTVIQKIQRVNPDVRYGMIPHAFSPEPFTTVKPS